MLCFSSNKYTENILLDHLLYHYGNVGFFLSNIAMTWLYTHFMLAARFIILHLSYKHRELTGVYHYPFILLKCDEMDL